MPVSHDVQDIIADVSAAIAERKVLGRAELEKLRRSLNEVARKAADGERTAGTERFALGELIAGIKQGVADLTGLASRADVVVQAGAAK